MTDPLARAALGKPVAPPLHRLPDDLRRFLEDLA